MERLHTYAARFDKPKIYRAVQMLDKLVAAEMREFE